MISTLADAKFIKIYFYYLNMLHKKELYLFSKLDKYFPVHSP